MTALYTVAMAVLRAPELAFVEDFRAHHDPQQCVIAPHFTLVFAGEHIAQAAYADHVERVAKGVESMAFCCLRALASRGDGGGEGWVFLVPDEGRSAIAELHARLHTGPLAATRRAGAEFQPHITVGRVASFARAQALCGELNRGGVQVQGRLDELCVGAIDAARFAVRARFALQA